MKIYTGQTSGDQLKKIISLNMGIMISSSPTSTMSKEISKTFCALDNGAFSCYRKGYPFMADVFLKTLSDAYKKNISLDFIVCPDIIAGGIQSLNFSKKWAENELQTAPKLALAVQDGVTPKDLGSISRFTHIFVGGTKQWKWETAEKLVNFAHDNGKKCHIGQCGRLEYLERAFEIGADSCDSTSFTVNNSFHIVEELYARIGYTTKETQLNLFQEVI